MEMRKQGGSEGQGTARSASKSPAGRKQAGEQTQGSPNQGENQQTTSHQASAGQPGGEQDLLQHAKQATGEIVNKVQQQAGSQLTRQKETAASQLSHVANAVRRLRENLPEEEAGSIGRVVGRVWRASGEQPGTIKHLYS